MTKHEFYKDPRRALLLDRPLTWRCMWCGKLIWRKSRALELEGSPCSKGATP